jgi:hypothetical protein
MVVSLYLKGYRVGGTASVKIESVDRTTPDRGRAYAVTLGHSSSPLWAVDGVAAPPGKRPLRRCRVVPEAGDPSLSPRIMYRCHAMQ